jgi:hypothetical protein
MAERSKAPDSSESFSISRDGCSGPRKRAWVQIPLLTNFLYFFNTSQASVFHLFYKSRHNFDLSSPTRNVLASELMMKNYAFLVLFKISTNF